MNSYEQQLENYLKNHGIDASVTLNSDLGFYSIRFKPTNNHPETIKYEIEHIDNDNVLLQLTVNSKVRDTTIKLASGTELYIEEFDPYSFLETTFSRNKIVTPANIKTVLADEVQAIIDDVKQYSM
jgi:hypothetical protein